MFATAGSLSRLQEKLRQARLIHQAKVFRDLADEIAAREPRGQVRADRLYRKAIRLLGDAGTVAPVGASVGVGGTAGAVIEPAGATTDFEATDLRTSRRNLEQRLSAAGLLALLRRHRRVRRSAMVAVAAAAMLVAAVPYFRQIVFPRNLAAGKSWTATSALPGYPDKGLVTGAPADPNELMFHTIEEDSPAMTIDLQVPTRIRRVHVENRFDCCQERQLPLTVEISSDGSGWKRVAYRRGIFREWMARFSSEKARFVRLRVDRRTAFHLHSVAVY